MEGERLQGTHKDILPATSAMQGIDLQGLLSGHASQMEHGQEDHILYAGVSTVLCCSKVLFM